jgi:hypothetical protein
VQLKAPEEQQVPLHAQLKDMELQAWQLQE